MRNLAIVLVLASTALATPAAARDGSPYIGIDAGILKARPLNVRMDNTTTFLPDAVRLKYKSGYDADLIAGYDAGMFRLEGEAAIKHSGLKSASYNSSTFDASGNTRVTSLMANALVDFGLGGFGASLGVGAGTTNVRVNSVLNGGALAIRHTDNAFAWQALAEIRTAISPSMDVGLKLRHFRTGRLDLGRFCETTACGAPSFGARARYKSNSLLASLIYNFGVPVVPAQVPSPPVIAAPEAPATQTCPDGSVILATSACPLPPAPPPPPPVQRGERGE